MNWQMLLGVGAFAIFYLGMWWWAVRHNSVPAPHLVPGGSYESSPKKSLPHLRCEAGKKTSLFIRRRARKTRRQAVVRNRNHFRGK